MKKLLFLTDESVLGGCAKSGVGEVVDSLANAMTSDYTVSIICPDGDGIFIRMAANLRQYKEGVRTCRLFGVDYYLVNRSAWPDKALQIADELNADILHNFAAPELISSMQVRPAKCIYTIDQAGFVKHKTDALKLYDAVTTVSEAYAAEILAKGDALSDTLQNSHFIGITNGILTPVFAPEKGFLVSAKYSADDLSGKEICKRRLLTTYGIKGYPCLYVMMCRMVRDKGLDDVLDTVHLIRDSGGFTIFVGKGDKYYEDQLTKITRADGAIWINKWPSPVQSIPMLAGADFYLSPSITEPCGLMPMHACRYGTIPIVTLNGGLADNMDDEIAVIVDDGGMSGAIETSTAIYADKSMLSEKRAACMNRDFSWSTRKAGYKTLYEG